MNKFSQKDFGAILYMYYINNYCENMFSFDNGTTLSKIKSHYNKLIEKYGLEEIEKKLKKKLMFVMKKVLIMIQCIFRMKIQM